jgi:1,4-alpha-glucan branching enzyme
VTATHVPVLGELDAYLIATGNHLHLYDALGAHVRTIDGVSGTTFAVWAPNARRVSVVGDFNAWDGRVHPLFLRRECGVWEGFVPGVGAGARYKYELEDAAGHLLPLRGDPIAFANELRPGTASIVWDAPPFTWSDDAWRAGRAARQQRDAPISIYEVHLGSWRRVPEDHDRFLTYRELDDARSVRARSRLHARRTATGHRTPLRRIVGLSDDGLVRADEPLRFARRFPRLRRCRARGEPRRDRRLGAGSFSDRCV